jgi:CHASE2 domain-containing sensor protein
VNVDLAESDLTPLDAELFATAVAPRSAADAQAQAAEQLTPADLERRQGMWWYLLLVALLLLGAETLLSNRLSRATR